MDEAAQFIAEMKMMYSKMSRMSDRWRDMWEDQLGDLDELIASMEVAHIEYNETDWDQADRDKFSEDNWDGGRF